MTSPVPIMACSGTATRPPHFPRKETDFPATLEYFESVVAAALIEPGLTISIAPMPVAALSTVSSVLLATPRVLAPACRAFTSRLDPGVLSLSAMGVTFSLRGRQLGDGLVEYRSLLLTVMIDDLGLHSLPGPGLLLNCCDA